MSVDSYVYVGRNVDGKTLPVAFVMKKVKEAVNHLIAMSYDKYGIKDYEKNESVPLVRNAAFLSSFICNPEQCLDEHYMTFNALFAIFTRKEDVGNSAQRDFRFAKEGMTVPHQSRNMRISESGNDSLMSYVDIDGTEPFMSIFMGANNCGKEFMANLAIILKESVGGTVYFLEADSIDAKPIEEVTLLEEIA